jgi:hypothetical protein
MSVATAKAEADGDEEEQAEACHAHEIPSVLFDRSRDVLCNLGMCGFEGNRGFGDQRLDD